ncbi:MAG: hypothetical protein U0Y82_11435 [Thermoleophilia bacterium]
MSDGPARRLGGWLVVGGLAGLVASPAAAGLRAIVRTRLRGPLTDPAAPFHEAPCLRSGGSPDHTPLDHTHTST